MRICKDGTWRYIFVDDHVPIKSDDSVKKHAEILGFNSLEVNGVVEIWPSLI